MADRTIYRRNVYRMGQGLQCFYRTLPGIALCPFLTLGEGEEYCTRYQQRVDIDWPELERPAPPWCKARITVIVEEVEDARDSHDN